MIFIYCRYCHTNLFFGVPARDPESFWCELGLMKKLTGVLIIGSPSRNIRISYLDEVDDTDNT
jgi:hypothetical protein